jgi:hypothetical protein
MIKSDPLQGLTHPLIYYITRQSLIHGAKRNIFVDGIIKQVIVGILKKNTHLPARLNEIVALDALPFVKDATGLICADPVQMFDQGGFAGPILAHQRNSVSGKNIKVNILQSAMSVRIAEAERTKLKKVLSIPGKFRVSRKIMHSFTK